VLCYVVVSVSASWPVVVSLVGINTMKELLVPRHPAVLLILVLLVLVTIPEIPLIMKEILELMM